MTEIVLKQKSITAKDNVIKDLKELQKKIVRNIRIVRADIRGVKKVIQERINPCNHMLYDEFAGEVVNNEYDLCCSICSRQLGKRIMIGDRQVTLINNDYSNKRLISNLIDKYSYTKAYELGGRSYLQIIE